jgi:hypothetical protein
VILGGASTPEPSTLVLAGTACLFGLLYARQRKGRGGIFIRPAR